jgi:hypothetical protein
MMDLTRTISEAPSFWSCSAFLQNPTWLTCSLIVSASRPGPHNFSISEEGWKPSVKSIARGSARGKILVLPAAEELHEAAGVRPEGLDSGVAGEPLDLGFGLRQFREFVHLHVPRGIEHVQFVGQGIIEDDLRSLHIFSVRLDHVRFLPFLSPQSSSASKSPDASAEHFSQSGERPER